MITESKDRPIGWKNDHLIAATNKKRIARLAVEILTNYRPGFGRGQARINVEGKSFKFVMSSYLGFETGSLSADEAAYAWFSIPSKETIFKCATSCCALGSAAMIFPGFLGDKWIRLSEYVLGQDLKTTPSGSPIKFAFLFSSEWSDDPKQFAARVLHAVRNGIPEPKDWIQYENQYYQGYSVEQLRTELSEFM